MSRKDINCVWGDKKCKQGCDSGCEVCSGKGTVFGIVRYTIVFYCIGNVQPIQPMLQLIVKEDLYQKSVPF